MCLPACLSLQAGEGCVRRRVLQVLPIGVCAGVRLAECSWGERAAVRGSHGRYAMKGHRTCWHHPCSMVSLPLVLRVHRSSTSTSTTILVFAVPAVRPSNEWSCATETAWCSASLATATSTAAAQRCLCRRSIRTTRDGCDAGPRADDDHVAWSWGPTSHRGRSEDRSSSVWGDERAGAVDWDVGTSDQPGRGARCNPEWSVCGYGRHGSLAVGSTVGRRGRSAVVRRPRRRQVMPTSPPDDGSGTSGMRMQMPATSTGGDLRRVSCGWPASRGCAASGSEGARSTRTRPH
jgi:hypothetical protein